MTMRQLNMYFWTFFFWGISFYWLSFVLPDFGWVGGVAIRGFVAAGLLVILARIMRRRLSFGNNWHHLAVLGFFSVGANLGGMNFALTRIGTSLTAILVTAIPLYSLIIECIWDRRRPTVAMVVGLILGFSGVVAVIGFTPQEINKSFMLGILGSAIASSGFAFGGNYARKKTQHIGSWEQTIGTFFFGGLFTTPLLIWIPFHNTPTWKSIGALVIVAATASCLAYILYFTLVDEIGATRALTTEFLVPVVAVIAGALLLHEKISGAQILGALMIFAGCALVLDLLPTKRA